jgi:hypothetical protein
MAAAGRGLKPAFTHAYTSKETYIYKQSMERERERERERESERESFVDFSWVALGFFDSMGRIFL